MSASSIPNISELLDEKDLSRITKLSVGSIRRRRRNRQAPKYLKLGAAIRYKPEDVAAWLESSPPAGEVSQVA